MVNILVAGAGGVGKSALTVQLTQKSFDVACASPTKQVVVDGEEWTLGIMLYSTEDESAAMWDSYRRTAQGYIIVYSVTSRSSFEEAALLYQQFLREKDEDSLPSVLVGNKCDLEGERQVGEQEGRDFAATIQCPFFETSAKAGVNIEEAFYELVREMREENRRIEELNQRRPKKQSCPLF